MFKSQEHDHLHAWLLRGRKDDARTPHEQLSWDLFAHQHHGCTHSLLRPTERYRLPRGSYRSFWPLLIQASKDIQPGPSTSRADPVQCRHSKGSTHLYPKSIPLRHLLSPQLAHALSHLLRLSCIHLCKCSPTMPHACQHAQVWCACPGMSSGMSSRTPRAELLSAPMSITPWTSIVCSFLIMQHMRGTRGSLRGVSVRNWVWHVIRPV